MKVLLFNSPIYKFHSEIEEKYLPPLGLAYIATRLNMDGIYVKIVDCVNEHYGIKEIFDILEIEKPDYIGFNIFTQNYEIVKEVVENCPIQVKILIGGQVVKCIYNDILQWDVANSMIIIVGEGELIIPDIVQNRCFEKPIANKNNSLVYKVDNNSSYFPNDLNSVHIKRSLLENDIYTNHYGQMEASIITSRGCPYNCAFCGGAHTLNKDITIRYRTIDDISNEINEILLLHKDVSSIRVLDDLFLRNNQSINDAITLFSSYPKLTWRGMAHILSFDQTNDNTLYQLQQSGCRELFFGIESGSKRIRKKINKMGSSEQIIKVISSLLEVGIDVKGYFMFGFPGETTEDADETVDLAQQLCSIANKTKNRFRLSVFQFRPYHGTKLYNDIVSKGITIPSITTNENLNIFEQRTQFNFQSGNYSNIEDNRLNEYIINTQKLSERNKNV